MAENHAGAVQGYAGDGSVEETASSVDTNRRLRPVNVSSVHRFGVEPSF